MVQNDFRSEGTLTSKGQCHMAWYVRLFGASECGFVNMITKNGLTESTTFANCGMKPTVYSILCV